MLLYRPWTKHQGRKNNGNDHQLKKLLIVKQILLVSTLRNVLRTVWRIYILMLGCKRLTHLVYDHKIFLSSCIQVCALAGTKDEILFHYCPKFFLLLFYQTNAYFVCVVDYRGSFRGRCLIKDEAQSICRIWNWLLSSERCCLYLKGGLEKSPEWLKREY